MSMHDIPSVISSVRLTLRDPIGSDIDSCVQRWTDEAVMLHMGGPREPVALRRVMLDSLELGANTDAGVNSGDRWWTIVETHTDQPIGDVGLIDKTVEGEPVTELVYVLDHDRWGKGLASEAAKTLLHHAHADGGYGRIVSLIREDHIASQRVASKAGMSFHKKTVRPGDGEDGRVMLVFVSET